MTPELITKHGQSHSVSERKSQEIRSPMRADETGDEKKSAINPSSLGSSLKINVAMTTEENVSSTKAHFREDRDPLTL